MLFTGVFVHFIEVQSLTTAKFVPGTWVGGGIRIHIPWPHSPLNNRVFDVMVAPNLYGDIIS